jgi:hypothetical protein
MSKAVFYIASGVILLLLSVIGPEVRAADAPFYEGKTLKVLVSSGTGGGTDIAARLVSRFIGKYLPGNPKDKEGDKFFGDGWKPITAERLEAIIREQTSISKEAKDFISKLRQKYNLPLGEAKS